MKLLLENWREFINENSIKGTVEWTPEQLNQIISYFAKGKVATFTDETVGHVSSRAFKKFDLSKTGANTAEGEHGKGKYNLDSYFGPMFGVNKEILLDPEHVKALGGKYILTVNLSGRFLKMNITDLRHYFPQSVENPNNPSQRIDTSGPMTKSIKKFKQILIDNGFDGIWWHTPGLTNKAGKAALTSDAVSVFNPSENAKITTITNLTTGQIEWKKEENETPT